jgi:L-lactate dehydrogenase complex protein LldG
MSSEDVEAFVGSAGGAATVHESSSATFTGVLDEAIEGPAIGTPLPFEGVSLADTPVETDFSPADLERAETGVTPVTVGVGEYGSVAVPSDAAGSELVSLYAPRHVAVVAASDVAGDMKASYERLAEEFADGRDTQVLATGPSATADMGTLVEGVHGPHEVHVIVLEDR